MNTETTMLGGVSLRDHLLITDALYRFGRGIDFNDKEMLASAFAPNATLNFDPCAEAMGIQLPHLSERENIAEFLTKNAGPQITSHVVTNVRSAMNASEAEVTALVEATHFPPRDLSRRCQMKNFYEAEMVQSGDLWVMKTLLISNLWFTGDPQVVIGN